MVIIGVAGEGVEIGLKLLRNRIRRIGHFFEKHELEIDFVGSVFWILVVIGLGMEWRGNHRASQIKYDQLVSAINTAGEANELTFDLSLSRTLPGSLI